MTIQETIYTETERLVKSSDDISVRVDEEIDRRVYILYGLSEEEIKIVDGKVSP